MTVRYQETGSVVARDRQKFGKRIRKDFFSPRRQGRGARNDRRFLGMLSAAKGLVNWGRLGTAQEVREYLFTIAPVSTARLRRLQRERDLTVGQEFLEPSMGLGEFIAWVFQDSPHCPSDPSVPPEGSPDLNQGPCRRPMVPTPASYRSGVRLRCRAPKCPKTYATYSSRRTHERKKHEAGSPN